MFYAMNLFMNLHHTPRLYIKANLAINETITLIDDHAHYLKNVLRLKQDDIVRVFNGNSAEFKAQLEITGKKSAALTLIEIIKPFAAPLLKTHLYFPLIKKDRMDWLIEKAVELGVTDLHPIITDHVKIREINSERVLRQIIEAAEQSERLTIPTLHNLQTLQAVIADKTRPPELLIALERADCIIPIHKIMFKTMSRGFIFGPEGGFSDTEKKWFLDHQHETAQLVSLGDTILRSETAGLMGLIYISQDQ